MHIKFPKKMEAPMRYLKLKLLPKTLFFRTMLLIIIPLIVVQIVSVIAYFSGSWGKVGKKLSDNLSSNMAFVVQLAQQDYSEFDNIKQLAKNLYEIDVEFFNNDVKHSEMNRTSQNNNIVTGFFEKSLRSDFPDAVTHLYLPEGSSTLIALAILPYGFAFYIPYFFSFELVEW